MTIAGPAARAILLCLVLPLALACPSRPVDCPRPAALAEQSHYFPLSQEKDVDLLFVIDNSGSMKEEQENLAKQFPRLIEALRNPALGPVTPEAICTAADRRGCKLPNVRIGVVSSDLGAGHYSFDTCEPGGDGGRLRSTPGGLAPPGCPTPADPWISYADSGTAGGAVTNVRGATSDDPVEQVKQAFSCIARLGIGGCGYEHQLEAAKRALEGCQVGDGAGCKTNPGFLRPDALLAIVWITDEDDCSARKPELFDPTQQGPQDYLGPAGFRCFEFGTVCDQQGRQPGPRTHCAPGLDWLQPVQGYVDFFKGLKGPDRVLLFAIAGPTEPVEVGLTSGPEGAVPALKASCNSINGHAAPAIRLASVVKSFGTLGTFNRGVVGGQEIQVDVCSTDFSPALQLIGESIRGRQTNCVGGLPLTAKGERACLQGEDLGDGTSCAASTLPLVECVVQERFGTNAAVEIERCPAELFDPAFEQDKCGGSCPCWRLLPNPDACKAGNGASSYELQVMRQGEAPKGAWAAASCATALPSQSAGSGWPQCL